MGVPEPVGLAEAIGTVRAELARAQAEGAQSDWRFSVEQVSLEFSVQFHRAGEGGAGLRLGVVEARLGGSVSRDSTHRIQVGPQTPATCGRHTPQGEPGGRRLAGPLAPRAVPGVCRARLSGVRGRGSTAAGLRR